MILVAYTSNTFILSKPLPQQLINSLQHVPGFEKSSFVATHQSGHQVTSVRFNTAKLSNNESDEFEFVKQDGNNPGENILQEPVPWCKNGRYLSERPSFTLDPLFHAGAYYVQEASSMFLDFAVKCLYKDADAPNHVLDLCAAPGGKSTLLAAALPQSFIVSNEVIKNRVTILAENISKWGSSNVAVTHNDPADFKKLPGFFDLLVVDAPCSGSGLFRKDPDAIDEWSESNVAHCSMRQQRILTDALPSLKTDGILIYCTCSYSVAEDETICDWLAEEYGLTAIPLPIINDWGIVETFSPKHRAPAYRFYPDKVKGEGFFIACFKQEKDVEVWESRIKPLQALQKNDWEMVSNWLSNPDELFLFKQKETIIGFHKDKLNEFSTVQQLLNVRKSGVAIGTIKGKDLVPHHELALRGLVGSNIMRIELDEMQAIQYLKRQDLILETSYKGWALAMYKGLPLGWMKVLGNRVNNYYPTEWRILKP